jgi:rhodanese-related sulfurtransferase
VSCSKFPTEKEKRKMNILNNKRGNLVVGIVIVVLLQSMLVLAPAQATIHTDIDVSTATNMITSGLYPNLLILDVRNQSEFNTGYISGAILLPVWQLQQRIAELTPYKNREIAVFCKTGGRALNASLILDANNFTNVYRVLGGMDAWKNASYPVIPQLNASVTPANTSVTTGQNATFSVSVSGGTKPYTYQWYEQGSLMTEQTNANITISKTAPNTFSYYCRIIDAYTATTNSTTLILTVTSQPTPTPAQTPLAASAFCSVSIMTGQTWYFFAHSCGGTGSCTYQWYEGTSMLAGQTSMLLPVTKTTAGTYTYTCKITDTQSTTATSNPITLTVTNR